MRRYRLSVVVEKDADGYFVFCPELQGCYSQGDKYKEALKNITDAIGPNRGQTGKWRKFLLLNLSVSLLWKWLYE